jgi:hypothetical protein
LRETIEEGRIKHALAQGPYFYFSSAKIPASHVCNLAQAVENQYGRLNSDSVTSGLARAAASKNAARDSHTLLVHANLKANVKISYLPKECHRMPILYMTDWMHALQERGQVARLYGGLKDCEVQSRLALYWDLMRRIIPDHEIYSMFADGSRPPSRCIPAFVHTDEGRGNKKTGVLVVSTSPALGMGTYKQRSERNVHSKLSLNFVGETLGNRFVHIVCPKPYYEKKPKLYKDMLTYVCLNSRLLLDDGFQLQGESWYIVYIMSIGDWVAHVKNGNLLRHFGNVVKNSATSPDKWKGICHCCGAGIKNLPFEDYSLTAACLRTVGLVEAWVEDGPLLNLIVYARNRHLAYAQDVWHGWSLGWGKETVAGGLVLASLFFPGSKIDARIAALNDAVAQYCEDNCEVLSFTAITKGKLGWPTIDSWPKGS